MGELIQDVRYALRRLRSRRRRLRSPPSSRSRSASAPTPRSSRSSTACSSGRCRFRIRIGSTRCTPPTGRRTLRAPCRPSTSTTGAPAAGSIEDLGGYFYAEGSTGVDLTGRGAAAALSAVFVTPGFFATLGVAPPSRPPAARGRAGPRRPRSRRDADRTGSGRASSARRRQSSGSTITLNGRAVRRCSACCRRDFRFPTDEADVFVPYSTIPDSGIPRLRPVRVLSVVARAKPASAGRGVSREMNAHRRAGSRRSIPEDRAWDARDRRAARTTSSPGPCSAGLLVLLGAVGFVLLMACVNVDEPAARAGRGRGREMAVRLALGARRGRLVRQLLTESLVLVALGGVVGLAVATRHLAGLLALGARQLPRAAEVAARRRRRRVLRSALALAERTAVRPRAGAAHVVARRAARCFATAAAAIGGPGQPARCARARRRGGRARHGARGRRGSDGAQLLALCTSTPASGPIICSRCSSRSTRPARRTPRHRRPPGRWRPGLAGYALALRQEVIEKVRDAAGRRVRRGGEGSAVPRQRRAQRIQICPAGPCRRTGSADRDGDSRERRLLRDHRRAQVDGREFTPPR